jgi:protein involved in polysaccharide export with SLBB domain
MHRGSIMTKPISIKSFIIKNFLRRTLLPVCGLLTFFALSGVSEAQVAPTAPTAERRPRATRAELEASLAEIDQILASPAISEPIKAQKRLEATSIRDRLENGDFQVGDQLQITLSVPITPGGQAINNAVFTIGPNQVLQLPDIPEIPLKGVLRSEVQDYLTENLKKLFKDQTVLVVPTIRLTILGGVAQPGFYQLPADTPLPDAIMKAGGPGQQTKLEDTVIRRGAEELWRREEVSAAITAGYTLDQMNLRAGDELVVGQESNTDWRQNLRTYMLIPGIILSLAALGRLFGIL